MQALRRLLFSPLIRWTRGRRPPLQFRLRLSSDRRRRAPSSAASSPSSSPPISPSENDGNGGASAFSPSAVSTQDIRKDDKKDEKAVIEVPSTPVARQEAALIESSVIPIPSPKEVLPPISDDEQRQLFKWILEEKRKMKPANPFDKKKLNDEKSLLKELIRANSIPSI